MESFGKKVRKVVAGAMAFGGAIAHDVPTSQAAPAPVKQEQAMQAPSKKLETVETADIITEISTQEKRQSIAASEDELRDGEAVSQKDIDNITDTDHIATTAFYDFLHTMYSLMDTNTLKPQDLSSEYQAEAEKLASEFPALVALDRDLAVEISPDPNNPTGAIGLSRLEVEKIRSHTEAVSAFMAHPLQVRTEAYRLYYEAADAKYKRAHETWQRLQRAEPPPKDPDDSTL